MDEIESLDTVLGRVASGTSTLYDAEWLSSYIEDLEIEAAALLASEDMMGQMIEKWLQQKP